MQELIVATDDRIDDAPALPPVIVRPVDALPAVAAPAPPTIIAIQVDPKLLAWLNHRGVVVAILLVCGPLGLPALWFSPRFSKTSKIAISVLFFLGTVIAPLALSWYWLDVAVRPVLDALTTARG
jgi:hypothetical protein